MIRFWDFKLTRPPPLLSWVVRHKRASLVKKPILMKLVIAVGIVSLVGVGVYLWVAKRDLDRSVADSKKLLEGKPDDELIRAAVDGWLKEQQSGRDGDEFWEGRKARSTLFAVRQWSIVDVTAAAKSELVGNRFEGNRSQPV